MKSDKIQNLLSYFCSQKLKKTNIKMVRLFFEQTVNMSLARAWEFFGNFTNIAAWDPNVLESKVYKPVEGPNKLGETYRLKTVFNGK